MDTSELANRLTTLEDEPNMHKQEEMFNQLKEELSKDDLELHVDENHCFAVRLLQVE